MLYSAVLDTCVLYPATLRDVLLTLAEQQLYRPLWSDAILEELRRNLIGRPGGHREDRSALVERLVRELDRAFEDARVTGYEPLIARMRNDPKDRHVLAVAVRARADAIVTYNLDDFPEDVLGPLETQAVHPDEFLLDQIDLDPDRVLSALTTRVAQNRRPPQTLADLGRTLSRSGLPGTARRLAALTGEAHG